MKIPAISGAEKNVFDTVFWKGVTHRNETYPLRGSLGVWWHLSKDLRLAEEDEDYVDAGNKPLPRMYITFLRMFFAFAQQDEQPTFFIKQGCRSRWLVRKTGAYWYDPRPEDPSWNPHRISFEFVRPVTEDEGRPQLGIGMKAFYLKEAGGWSEPPGGQEPNPLPLSVPQQVAMPPKKGKDVKDAKDAKDAKAAKATKAYAATYMESNDVPLIVEEVVVVKVVPLEVSGVAYLRDPVKHKVYTRTGGYVGRWSPKDETIHTEIPNSDDE